MGDSAKVALVASSIAFASTRRLASSVGLYWDLGER
jgi:hypothetical protein